MSKDIWKPGNMLYPIPVVMVSCGSENARNNIITVAWAGTICSDPAMVSISVRPERHSYNIIRESGEFVINLVTKDLAYATDWCGVKSGRDVDKFEKLNLTAGKANALEYAPIIVESPVNIECKVKDVLELGSHHMFVAEVKSVQVSGEHMNETGKFEFNKLGPVAYSHGEYFELGEKLGKFGYSVKKK
ncbi:flavin reductase family protein [Eubacterium xylanophilum]|uniref:flavin reductase family protein n=1 Tax=Eubacterium xylanophilum TaxID=39497 RepID=UPI00047CC520|nr:flavin reductase family protein [Eubacterium xylanophilum]